jgi:ketosteroid isomerase-like protein
MAALRHDQERAAMIWRRATAAGDVDAVLRLMAEDVVTRLTSRW